MRILIVDDIRGWREYHAGIVKQLFPEAGIVTAECAKDAYDIVFQNTKTPFDIIITDMQMETDYEPLYAGEWLIERIKELSSYYRTKIVIISATYNIQNIADRFGVSYIRKGTARTIPDSYLILKES